LGKRYCTCGSAKLEHHELCEACWALVPPKLRAEWWEFPAHRHRRATRNSIKAFLRNRQMQRSFIFSDVA